MDDAIVAVKDAFEIKAGTAGSNHAPGLVVIFDGRQCGFKLPPLGATVNLLRPDGASQDAVVEEVKEHGEGRSFFLRGLTLAEAPVGTIVSWTPRPASHAGQAGTLAAH
jgi:hypothetical protein